MTITARTMPARAIKPPYSGTSPEQLELFRTVYRALGTVVETDAALADPRSFDLAFDITVDDSNRAWAALEAAAKDYLAVYPPNTDEALTLMVTFANSVCYLTDPEQRAAFMNTFFLPGRALMIGMREGKMLKAPVYKCHRLFTILREQAQIDPDQPALAA